MVGWGEASSGWEGTVSGFYQNILYLCMKFSNNKKLMCINTSKYILK